MNCSHYWIASNGLCAECGQEPELPHQHRFEPAPKGATMLTCQDCRMVVFVEPEKPAPDLPENLSLPDLLHLQCAPMPSYLKASMLYEQWNAKGNKRGW